MFIIEGQELNFIPSSSNENNRDQTSSQIVCYTL